MHLKLALRPATHAKLQLRLVTLTVLRNDYLTTRTTSRNVPRPDLLARFEI